MTGSEMIASAPVRGNSKNNVAPLATPKQSKATWWTSFGPDVTWGNQDPMYPISPSALKAAPSQRLRTLAEPKKNHQKSGAVMSEFYYSCGRSSQIWRVTPSTMIANPTDRVSALARPKTVPDNYLKNRPQSIYSCGRMSTIWQPNRRTRSCPERARTAYLARPKQTHIDYRPNRHAHTTVSEAAQTCIASDHIASLARPKTRLDGLFRDSYWPVSKVAMQATPTERVIDLAKPKRLPEGHQPNKDVLWRISPGARSAVASNRMNELSKPIIRESMDHLQFNPDAFIVSDAAKRARASARIEELAQPIQRGAQH